MVLCSLLRLEVFGLLEFLMFYPQFFFTHSFLGGLGFWDL